MDDNTWLKNAERVSDLECRVFFWRCMALAGAGGCLGLTLYALFGRWW